MVGYLRFGFDERADRGLDRGDLLIEEIDNAGDAFDHGAVVGFAATVFLLGSHRGPVDPAVLPIVPRCCVQA